MSFDLHVITPCARPGNLARIAESIARAERPPGVRLHWLVVLDDRFDIPSTMPSGAEVVTCRGAAGVAGHAGRNDALERIADGWIVFVDDDNVLHPDLPRCLAETVSSNPSASFIVFDQDLGDGVRRAGAENVRVGAIDSGQFAFERTFAADERFDVYAYSADGIFASRLYAKAPDRFTFVSRTAAFYNALNRGHFGEPPSGRNSKGPLPQTHNAGSLHFHRTFATEELIRLGSNVRGHRLYLTSGAVMRAPVAPGHQRLRGHVWLQSSSRGVARLQIAQGDQSIVDLPVRLPRLLRFLGGSFDVSFDVPMDAEIELRVTGAGSIVLEI